MAFKVPTLLPAKANTHVDTRGLPTFNWKDLKNKDIIGQGSFGVVFTAEYNSETIVVKKLLGENDHERKRFIKEARFLHNLQSDFTVKFLALSVNPMSMMLLEYEFFDFAVFGNDKQVTSLKGLMTTLHEDFRFEGFDAVPLTVGCQIATALEHLHGLRIAHRDLKTLNGTVSNQHYRSLKDGKQIEFEWGKCPVICKLIDFGESRSEILQTNTILNSHTQNVDRGTMVYMAPELLEQGTMQKCCQEDLLRADIWSLGLIFFILVSPDLSFPYENDLGGAAPELWQNIVKDKIKGRLRPTASPTYTNLRDSIWRPIKEAQNMCLCFQPEDRADIRAIRRYLTRCSGEEEESDHGLAQGNHLTDITECAGQEIEADQLRDALKTSHNQLESVVKVSSSNVSQEEEANSVASQIKAANSLEVLAVLDNVPHQETSSVVESDFAPEEVEFLIDKSKCGYDQEEKVSSKESKDDTEIDSSQRCRNESSFIRMSNSLKEDRLDGSNAGNVSFHLETTVFNNSKSETPSIWKETSINSDLNPVVFFDEYPVLHSGLKKRITAFDAARVLLNPAINLKLICQSVPSRVQQNLMFIVNLHALDNNLDITADDNGATRGGQGRKKHVYCKTSETAIESLKVESDTVEKEEDEDYFVLTKYNSTYESAKDFHRCIIKLQPSSGSEKFFQYCIIQYIFDGEEHPFAVLPHRDARKRAASYKQTAKSVRESLFEALSLSSPKEALFSVSSFAGGYLSAKSSASLPRNYRQAVNMKASSKVKSEQGCQSTKSVLADLMEQCKRTMNNHSKAFIWKVEAAPEPMCIIGTEKSFSELIRSCCTGPQGQHSVLCIDPTFDLGEFAFTPTSFSSQAILQRATG